MRIVPRLIGLLLMTSLSLPAQEIRFSVRTSSDTLLEGHLLQLTYHIENAEARSFQPPDFHPFEIVSGPQQSTSMQIINGKVSRQASITYLLHARKPGSWLLPPARISAGDQSLECPGPAIVVRPNPAELPDPRFPGWKPKEARPEPGDSIREKLLGNRRSYRL